MSTIHDQRDRTFNDARGEVMTQAAADNLLLDQGKCPRCESPEVSIKLADRQAGPTAAKGKWHNVRCECGYIADHVRDV